MASPTPINRNRPRRFSCCSCVRLRTPACATIAIGRSYVSGAMFWKGLASNAHKEPRCGIGAESPGPDKSVDIGTSTPNISAGMPLRLRLRLHSVPSRSPAPVARRFAKAIAFLSGVSAFTSSRSRHRPGRRRESSPLCLTPPPDTTQKSFDARQKDSASAFFSAASDADLPSAPAGPAAAQKPWKTSGSSPAISLGRLRVITRAKVRRRRC